VLAVAAAFAPLVAVGQAEFAILRFQGALIMPGWMTVNALNLWYLLTLGDGNWVYDGSLIHPDTASLIGFISSRRIGTALLTIWTAAVLWVQARSEITMKADSAQRQDARSGLQTYWRWSLAGALLYLGLFLWPTGAHERYNFGALILLLVARLDPSAPRRPLWGLFILLSILHILNLWWAAVPMPWMTLFAGSVPFGLVVSLGMLCAGAWGLYLLIQGRSVE
jgi:hypothetical protein